jgi:ABC-type iron transport system FetAB ATPase subunit
LLSERASTPGGNTDQEFIFNIEIKKGEPYTFEVGEKELADRLFYVLCKLDTNYDGTIGDPDNEIDFSNTPQNNVLALGDRTLFINGTIYRNIYLPLRARHNRAEAKQKTQEIIKTYNLNPKQKMKTLSDDEILTLALARAHFREPKLVIINRVESYITPETEIDYSRWSDSYIININ